LGEKRFVFNGAELSDVWQELKGCNSAASKTQARCENKSRSGDQSPERLKKVPVSA